MSQPSDGKVEVQSHPFGRGVYARAALRPGEVVLTGWGPRVPRSRHSFQVGPDEHVRIENEIELINHSCEPNCGVLLPLGAQSLQIVALRPVAAGEELTTDYAMHDWEIEFMPDSCLCGSPLCRGRVTGYRDLPAERRRAYGPYVAAYLPALEAALHETAGRPLAIDTTALRPGAPAAPAAPGAG